MKDVELVKTRGGVVKLRVTGGGDEFVGQVVDAGGSVVAESQPSASFNEAHRRAAECVKEVSHG